MIKDYAKNGIVAKDAATCAREKAEAEKKFQAKIAKDKAAERVAAEAEKKAREGKYQPFKNLGKIVRGK